MTTILEQANNGIPIPNLQPTYLNPVIRETLELVCIAKRPAIRTSLDLDDDVILNIDKNQIAQVLTNLIRNAIEAMQNSGQNLRIKTTHLSNGIEIAVIDDGPGIDPAVADHLFEPFVTSKLTGAGIGLSISLGVVKAHHGELSLRVTNDNCTWFVIYLPK
jgi:signal transduction histidine kinase